MTPSGMNDMGPEMADLGAGGPTGPAAPTPASGSGSGQQDCVPLSALNMPDESEQMQAPEVGDNVQYTVEGKVAKIVGDQAYIDRETVNGQAVGGADAGDPNDQNPAEPDGGGEDQAGMDDLQRQAKGVQLQ